MVKIKVFSSRVCYGANINLFPSVAAEGWFFILLDVTDHIAGASWRQSPAQRRTSVSDVEASDPPECKHGDS